jgi:5'-3' exonuclease
MPILKEVLNTNIVIEKYGIHPRNFALARAMAGDPSDNLAGVPRVGLGTVAKRFPFLKEDKDYYISDILDESSDSNNNKLKVYQNVLESEEIIKENYDIMQLSSPQMSIQCKTRIDQTLEEYQPHYNQTEVRKLMLQDGVLTVNMSDLEQKFNDIITSFSD